MWVSSDSEPEEEEPPGLQRRRHDPPTSWLYALRRYVLETDMNSLCLTSMKLKIQVVTSILEFLPDSAVTELDLSDNNLQNHMETLSGLLIETKIKKLNVRSCHLKHSDIMSLMKVLKDTQIKDLDISENHIYQTHRDREHLFISYLVESHLSVLNLAGILILWKDEEVLPFIQALRKTLLTHLNMKGAFRPEFKSDSFLFLFSELKHTSITHLNIADCSIRGCDFRRLGDSLRDSKLIELDLSETGIKDRQVDDLLRAIIGSKITSLSLASNGFIFGNNNLGRFLKETQITHLDLSDLGRIDTASMFSFPDFLRDSSVVSLKLGGCDLPDVIGVPLMKSLRFSKLTDLDISDNELHFRSIAALAEAIKDSNIRSLDFSDNYASNPDALVGEGLLLIAELSVGSPLKHLNLSEAFQGLSSFEFNIPALVVAFFEILTNSSITSLNMMSFHAYGLVTDGAEIIWPSLANTQFTHLNLEGSRIGSGVFHLAANLKSTAITHLNLKWNGIKDDGVKVLADCLKETGLVDLDLSYNEITCHGAIALADFLKDVATFSLKLDFNLIKNQGLAVLAEHIQPNLLTSLEVSCNLGDSFVVETVVMNNQRIVHQLVSLFKLIAPETMNNVLQFEDLASTRNIDTFLEECLHFYKLATEQPSAAKAIAREESILFSRDQIATLLYDEFPKQFSWFISSKIEADVTEHVKFLKRVEELGLSRIVELLLLNRPVYTIDESRSILHPFVYELLIKYKLPVCNLDVEPQGIERIVKYFTTAANIEGAADVVRLLEGMEKAAEKTEN